MSRRRSKKRSVISSRRGLPKLPKLPTIYIDESLSQRLLGDVLKQHKLDVKIRADLFREGVADVDWLAYAGKRRWIVLTKDKAIRRRSNELLVLMNARVRAFVLSAGEMTGEQQADLFERLIPKLRWWIAQQPAPFVVRVEKSGRTELVATETDEPIVG